MTAIEKERDSDRHIQTDSIQTDRHTHTYLHTYTYTRTYIYVQPGIHTYRLTGRHPYTHTGRLTSIHTERHRKHTGPYRHAETERQTGMHAHTY